MKPAADIEVIHDKLYTLDTVLEPEKIFPTLSELARRNLGDEVAIHDVQVEVIRRRNQRCVVRYIVEGMHKQSGQPRQWRVIGKVYKANRGEGVFATMQSLWKHGFHRNAADHISIPEPLFFDSRLCVLFQEEVPGLPIKVLLKTSPKPEYMRQLARAIAKLHKTPPTSDEIFGVDDHLLRCHPRYPFLHLALPELKSKINFIVNTAKKIEQQLDRTQIGTIHGDFHLGQAHIENGKIWLIDFDALSFSDPAADLGNLLVFLKGKVKRHPHYIPLIEAFLDEYFSLMEPQISQRIPLFEGLTHLRRACKCLRYQKDGWKRRVYRMIDQGVASIEEMLAGANADPLKSLRSIKHEHEMETLEK